MAEVYYQEQISPFPHLTIYSPDNCCYNLFEPTSLRVISNHQVIQFDGFLSTGPAQPSWTLSDIIEFTLLKRS